MTLPLFLIVAGIIVLALAMPRSIRPVFACLAAGCLIGLAGAGLRSVDPAPVVYPSMEGPLSGVVVSDPSTSAKGTTATVSWRDGQNAQHDVFVFFPAGVDLGRGDEVTLSGELIPNMPSPAISANSVAVSQQATRLELARRAVRGHFTDQTVKSVSGSPGSLVLGLLIGDDAGLSSVERADLRMSGLSHITAVSGWNVSVVVVSTGAVFRALGARSWGWLLVQLGLLSFYVWIVGLEPPIQRAAIMGAIALIALQLGRPAHMLTLLTITAGLMATWNPEVLSSLAFMLSFLAMIGLAVAARITVGLSGWQAAMLAPATAAGFAGIATAPLVAATFGTASLMTVPANALAAPLTSFATFGGMIVVATSWIPFLSGAAGWVTWILCAGLLWIARLFAGVPGGHLTFAPIEASTVFTIYLGLAFLLAPFIPEGRAMLRRLDHWFESAPWTALFTALIIVCVLALGVLMF